MTDLTPNAIVDYPLRTGVRGYRVDEVDALLDRVADRIEQLQGQLAERDAELARLRARVEEAGATEDTLSRTLLTAQRAAEQTVAEAEQEAERLRGEARGQADELLRQTQRRGTSADKNASRAREAEEKRPDAQLSLL